MNKDDQALFEKQKEENENLSADVERLMNERNQAILDFQRADTKSKELSHIEDEYNKLFNESQTVKHELAESGKNLYEANNLLKMCRKEKEELKVNIKTGKELLEGSNKRLALAQDELRGTCSIKVYEILKEENKMLLDANEVLRDHFSFTVVGDCDTDQGNTYWPFHGADLNAVAWCLFFSISVICITAYLIINQIGF